MNSDKIEMDLRYEYIQVLCQSIEKYTKDAETENSYAFQYGNINLKFAVERYLYFKFVDHSQLYNWFCRSIQNNPRETFIFKSIIEKKIALCLLESSINNKNYRYHPLAFLQDICSNIWYKILTIFWNLQPTPQLAFKKIDILVWLNQPKHARYLLPIINNLDTSYSYLLVGRRENKLKSFLQNHQMSAINTRGIKIKSLPKSKELRYFRELTTYCDRIYESLKILKPKCVILVEGNSPIDEITNQVCKQLLIPTICIQHGWSPIIHNGFRNMSYTKMLVWGQGFANLLKKYNPQQSFAITGSHILNQNNHIELIKNIDAKKSISFFLQSPKKLCSCVSWNKILKLILLTAKNFSDIPILVREHPNYPLSFTEKKSFAKFSNIEFVDAARYSLTDVLERSLVSISVFSTTILESVVAEVIPIIFNVTSMPNYYPNLHEAGVGIEVKNIDEAVNAIEKLVLNREYRQKIQLNFKKFQYKYFNLTSNHQENIIYKIIQEVSECY